MGVTAPLTDVAPAGCNENATRMQCPWGRTGRVEAETAQQIRLVTDGGHRTRLTATDRHTPGYGRSTVSTQPLVLVADDEPRITKLVAIALSEEGFRVVTANGGEQALQKAEEVRPDIVLLDIVMPDLDGIEVMRQLRERRPVPVILLTAKGSTADKAKGLDLGADDYIAKPFHPDELAARVRAVIRRSGGAEPGAGVIKFDDVEIDLERRMVTRNGELVQLSRTEWLLLQHLAANAGKVVLHTELLTKVWGPEYRDDLQYLRVWVSRVRRKLGAAPGEPGRIRTFQGIGYLLDVDTSRHEPEPEPEPVRDEAAALIG
jgi:two-component system, OmpR family, KDP operon response regulator KdpE